MPMLRTKRKKSWRDVGLRAPRFLTVDEIIETPMSVEQIIYRLELICVHGQYRMGAGKIWGHPLKKQGRPFVFFYRNLPTIIACFGTILDCGDHRKVVLSLPQPILAAYMLGALFFLAVFGFSIWALIAFAALTLAVKLYRKSSHPRGVRKILKLDPMAPADSL